MLHGLFLAVFLWQYKKGNRQANLLLSALLLVLSFRVGKSVFLEFAEHLDIKLIFIGLATLMSIGPLFYLFVQAHTAKPFQWRPSRLLHFVPSVLGICFGIFIQKDWLERVPIYYFALVFLGYYGHYLVYLFKGYSAISLGKKNGVGTPTIQFLKLVFVGLLSIWLVYVLNLFDEFVPYIVGPILYSVIAYLISFIVIRKGYIDKADTIKYRTTKVSPQQIKDIYQRFRQVVVEEKGFKNPDLTLKSLSAQLNQSTQVLSMVINQETKRNFNSCINQLRVQEAIVLLQDIKFEQHTVASIAFEVGFNSISSFNKAFKKETASTPMAYRNGLTK